SCCKLHLNELCGRSECFGHIDLEGVSRTFNIGFIIIKITKRIMRKKVVQGRAEMAHIAFLNNRVEAIQLYRLEQFLWLERSQVQVADFFMKISRVPGGNIIFVKTCCFSSVI